MHIVAHESHLIIVLYFHNKYGQRFAGIGEIPLAYIRFRENIDAIDE